jgi:hypothetical protein
MGYVTEYNVSFCKECVPFILKDLKESVILNRFHNCDALNIGSHQSAPNYIGAIMLKHIPKLGLAEEKIKLTNESRRKLIRYITNCSHCNVSAFV